MTNPRTKTVLLVNSGPYKDKIVMMVGMAKEELLTVYLRNAHTGFFMCVVDEEYLVASMSKKVIVYGNQIEPIELFDDIRLTP